MYAHRNRKFKINANMLYVCHVYEMSELYLNDSLNFKSVYLYKDGCYMKDTYAQVTYVSGTY